MVFKRKSLLISSESKSVDILVTLRIRRKLLPGLPNFGFFDYFLLVLLPLSGETFFPFLDVLVNLFQHRLFTVHQCRLNHFELLANESFYIFGVLFQFFHRKVHLGLVEELLLDFVHFGVDLL